MTRIEKIAAREKAAASGPWRTIGAGGIAAKEDPGWGAIATAWGSNLPEGKANQELIAHAREDIPYLLVQLKDREEAAERAKQAIQDWEMWAMEQDSVPPDDLLEWSRRSLEELARILKGGE